MLIRGHDLQKHRPEQFDILANLYGITGYQLAIKKSFDIKNTCLSETDIESIDSVVFQNTKILGAYFNPVHPDKEEVKVGIENFIFNMKLAQKFGIKLVGSETGSKMGSPWDYHPDNHLEETIAESIAAFKEIADRTKELDVQIAIEPAYHHVVKDIDALEQLYDVIGDSRVVYIMDLFNLLNARAYENYKEVATNFLNRAKSKVKIVHLKDFIIENNQVKQVPIGTGIVDFTFVIDSALAVNPDVLFVLEGTLEQELPAAMQAISNKQ
ncbi:TIM barrel protein [Mollicutes bacterium LVI A0039]|nr:TIM barrel protein [Mollicutes bacterium LVI A0039]